MSQQSIRRATTDNRGPVEPEISTEVEEAIGWMLRLTSVKADDGDRAEHRAWLEMSPAHVAAWNTLGQSMQPLDTAKRMVMTERKRKRSVDRRSLLRSIVGVGAVGAASAVVANRFVPIEELGADAVTRTGQVKAILLADGSTLTLAPRTAVDFDVTPAARRVRLREGQMLLTSRSDTSVPFVMTASDFTMTSAGGTFGLRWRDDVMVATAVDAPADIKVGHASRATLDAGESVVVVGDRLSTRMKASKADTSWVDGLLVCNNESLSSVVARLRPYFPGVIRVDPAIAALPVSAVLDLTDLPLTFDLIATTLKVKVRHITPYWMSIDPAPDTMPT